MYLTYNEYKTMGGTLSETDFNTVIIDVENIVDWYTFNRLTKLTTIDTKVKQCVYRLIELVITKQEVLVANPDSTIKVQENDGVIVHYEAFKAPDLLVSASVEISSIVKRYLTSVKDLLGRPVLYRGIYGDE